MTIEFTLQQIEAVAEKLLRNYPKHKIWAFFAPMGSGKTTFIHALCNVLQVADVVSSPTFAIINEYSSNEFKTIYHMDWYRLKDEDEAIQAGVEDALKNGDLCLVEWPENAIGLLPDDVLKITLQLLNTDTRRLIVN